MGNQTIGAIFCFVINQGVISATFRQRIQRAITKQAVEVIIIFHLMAREIFTLVVSEKFRTVIHGALLSFNQTVFYFYSVKFFKHRF